VVRRAAGFFWPEAGFLAWGLIFPAWGQTFRQEKNINTKMEITFASGLRFRWTWARWNHHNELYNFIHKIS
jgi:hypothetical protein